MKKQLILLPLVAMALVACGNGGETSSSSEPPSSSEPAWEGKTNKDFSKAKTSYVKDGVEHHLNRNELYKNQDKPHLDPMSTESHVMVVPFGFTDSSLASVQTEANRARIEKAFLGSTEEIKAVGGWESLASFYNKSSYGNTKIDGKVLPWCVYPGTTSTFVNGGHTACEFARQWYIDEYEEPNHGKLGADAEPLSYFDADNDGFIDLIWVVYSAPTVDVNTQWWAYVSYTNNPASTDPSKPNAMTFGWASIDWMDKGFGGYDTHTFIHETGHTLGLDDYYDYNNRWKPIGGIDFMDQNLGDHSMYSKFSLGWTAPLVVDDTARITLHPGTTTGDCFVLPSPNYNGTAFDEYMMLELMAPVGLAEQDYKNGYQYTKGYSEPGIRITHVDARVYSSDHNKPLTDHPEEGIDVRLDNSYGGRNTLRFDSDFMPRADGTYFYTPQFSIMESSFNTKSNWTNNASFAASNASLFKENAKFNLKSGMGWAENFMPSGSNLWNKAKTIKSWQSPYTPEVQTYEIDSTCTFNYSVKVVSIEKHADYGYEAVVEVTKNAY